MKSEFIAALAVLAFGACCSSNNGGETGASSGSGTTGGSATTTGGSCVTTTFTTVDIHPAAKAALTAIGFPVPSITNGEYQLDLQGVSLGPGPSGPVPVLTDAGFTTITSTTGPYPFTVCDSFLLNDGTLGVLGGVNSIAPAPMEDGGLLQPTCPEWAALTAGVQGVIADGGVAADVSAFLSSQNFKDYIIPTGLLVGGVAQPPTADAPNAIAYAIPMSYAVILNCAGNPGRTTRDTDLGEALVYITNGTAPGQGTPVSGATVAVAGAIGNPAPTYYEDSYMLTDNTGTDSTGVATFLAVTPQVGPPMATIHAPGLTFIAKYGISTNPNTFFSIVAYPH